MCMCVRMCAQVRMTAKVYAYYGLNQFSYPIAIDVLQSGKGACPPVTIDSIEPFTYASGCNADAEQLEGTEVTVECLKVVMVGTDLDDDGTTGDDTRHLQTHSCCTRNLSRALLSIVYMSRAVAPAISSTRFV